DRVGSNRVHGPEHVLEEGHSQDWMQDLGLGALHARALARGEDEGLHGKMRHLKDVSTQARSGLGVGVGFGIGYGVGYGYAYGHGYGFDSESVPVTVPVPVPDSDTEPETDW